MTTQLHANPDILIRDFGTVWSFRGSTEAAQAFLADDIESESWQWNGGALVVDHRPARGLLDFIVTETDLTFDVI